MALGERIRKARFSAGMTQAALARAAGVSERNIVRWENNHNAPRLEHVSAIAGATGKDVDFFTVDEPLATDDDEESDPMADLMAAIRSLVRAEVSAVRP